MNMYGVSLTPFVFHQNLFCLLSTSSSFVLRLLYVFFQSPQDLNKWAFIGTSSMFIPKLLCRANVALL